MASAAFKSTTRRSLYAASPSDPPPRTRSRSVSAAPRVEEDYANTRDNPLFDSAVSPPRPATATTSGAGDAATRERDRGREALGGGGRARSVSVALQGRRTGTTSSAYSAAADGGRRSSRACRSSETDMESRDMRKLQSWKTRDSVVEGKHRGTHASCLSQGSSTEVTHRKMDETSQPVSGTAVSSPGYHLEHQSLSADTVDSVLEIPPEFDPDFAEFVFAVNDHAMEYRNEDAAEISLDSDTDAVELPLDIRHNATDQGWEPIEIPLEFDPDAAEPVSDTKHHDAKQQ